MSGAARHCRRQRKTHPAVPVRGGHLVLAYHGCDVSVRDELISGQLPHLQISSNPYDWLGPGTYFFEDDPVRALLFARASADHPEKMLTRKAIVTPAVVGAILCVGNVLDMTTQAGIDEFQRAHAELVRRAGKSASELPQNMPAASDDLDILLRKLDRAVFVLLHELRREQGLAPYDLVRGAFLQGEPVATSSAFRNRTHVQLALLNPACVAGWILPPGDKLLDAAELAKAKAELQRANSKRKPRMRAA